MKHELCVEPQEFREILSGNKKFKVVFKSSDYKRGDVILLKEHIACENRYTGNELSVVVVSVTEGRHLVFEKDDFYVLSIELKDPLKYLTEDELRTMILSANIELANRAREDTIRVFEVKTSEMSTFFKNFDEAIKDFLDDIESDVKEYNNSKAIIPKDIPETEYNLRPNVWHTN